jgi:phosphate transport system permease protein
MRTISDYIPPWTSSWRRYKDRAATATISAGGAGVLLAILLIFFYLVYEVVPLFGPASLERLEPVHTGRPVAAAYLALEEQGEIALLVGKQGQASFIDISNGSSRLETDLTRLSGSALTAVAEASAEGRLLGLGYANGSVAVVKHEYRLSYPDDKRVITPRLDYPYGEASMPLARGGQSIEMLALRDSEQALVIAAQLGDESLVVKRYAREENFLSGEIELVEETLSVPQPERELAGLFLGVDLRWLYQVHRDASYRVWDLSRTDGHGRLLLADEGQLFSAGSRISTATQLLGGISLLAASEAGELAQFFMVRGEQGQALVRIRDFDTGGAVVRRLIAEHRRKGFLALDDRDQLQIFHSTASRRLLRQALGEHTSSPAAISPRADKLLLVGPAGRLLNWSLHNEHPEVSWSALWSAVWYESYPEPDYIWQSSASNNDFEPKYSFAPLAFGTLKAAFYAMLVAAPLAICGAIYTAYFMAPALRRKIKPLIELMEALPTVILGFLAGLWLAPFIEAKLTGVFTVLLLMPVGVLLFAFAWSRLPLGLRTLVPDGWHAVLLLPVVCLVAYACFGANDTVELLMFGGDMRGWITNEMGISFDQRNALVVGIAMGMAVIPTIFSIAEDAIFAVPRHLSYGSLALGATPWQTLVGVVLPTASPGIFSGLMIGLGRAVGETMIVLMATGNTPIMDANIFEGMRTLAANIAVEVPEAEVDSSHYRVLFLAAFVLFIFTFVVNTMAELIRQRLRVKYGSL